MDFERNRDQIEAEEWFPYVLGKLHAIEWMEFSPRPDEHDPRAPRFCWRYRQADSSAYNSIGQAVSEFDGDVLWRLDVNYQRCCIAAIGRGGAHREDSQSDSGLNAPRTSQLSALDQVFLTQAMAEIPALCQHIEERLGIRNLASKPLSPEPGGPPRQQALPRDLEDFVEPGMHTIWLARDPAAFESGSAPTSRADRMLHFGVTDQEWQIIRSEVLDPDGRKHETSATNEPRQAGRAHPSALNIKVHTYPMLSRIRDYRYDVIYETEEVRVLRQECQQAMTRTSNVLALRGLEKLSRICAQAIRRGLGIYMMSP
jgi:hypothetical protein